VWYKAIIRRIKRFMILEDLNLNARPEPLELLQASLAPAQEIYIVGQFKMKPVCIFGFWTLPSWVSVSQVHWKYS